MPKLLFIIGMQKSGTSLLNRLLMQQSFITNPFLPEGKFFWGDDPPFSPTASPCGTLYQKYSGSKGHQLDEEDCNAADRQLLIDRIHQAGVSTPILMNKNPYNSLRVPWLKKYFPDCKIVAMVRKPEANVYSLLKKYAGGHVGVGPENGWWGIKPNQWQALLTQDKLIQSTRQWAATNQRMLENKDQIDYVLEYASLCAEPEQHLTAMASMLGSYDIKPPDAHIRCMDDEYRTGGEIQSKNRHFRQKSDFQIPESINTDFLAFTNTQITQIKEFTDSCWQQLRDFTQSLS